MVSVLMLTHDREKLVGRAIESILAQTYPDYEFIIIDNGSSDRSGEIARSYADKDKRIKVIRRPEGTISAGRNTALDAAKGDLITFIDDDDWCEPDYLEFLLSLITENNAGISICGTNIKSFDEKKIMTAEEALIELLWRKFYNTGFPSKMFRRSALQNMRFSESLRYDDIDLMYKLITNSGKVVYHGLPKYNVYRHSGNNSAWTTDHSLLSAEILDEYLTAYRKRTEWLYGRFPKRLNTWKYFEWSFMISMIEKIGRLKLNGCEKQTEYMEKELSDHYEDFMNCPEILDFEREWTKKYICKDEM